MQTIKRWGVKKIGLVMISTSLISCGGGYRNEVLVDIFNKNKYSFNIIKDVLVDRSSIELVSLNAQADSVQNYCSDGVYPYEACATALLSLKRAGVKEIRSFRCHDNSALVSIRFLMFRRGLFFGGQMESIDYIEASEAIKFFKDQGFVLPLASSWYIVKIDDMH